MNKAIGTVAGLLLLLGMTSTAQAATEGPGGCSFPGMTCQTSVTSAPPAAAPAAPADPATDARCSADGAGYVCNLEYTPVGTQDVVARCQSYGGETADVKVRWGVWRSTLATYDAARDLVSYSTHEEAEYGGVLGKVGPCSTPEDPSPVPAAPATPAEPQPATPAPGATAGGETAAVPAPAEAPAAPAETAAPVRVAASGTPAPVTIAPVTAPQRLTAAEARGAATSALRRRYGKRDFGLQCSVESAWRATCRARAGRTRVTASVVKTDASAAATLRAKPVR